MQRFLYTIPDPYRWGLIAALLVLALFFGLGGAWRLHQSRSTLSPHHPEQTDSLTVSGVFRLTRNPMYRALLLGLVAWSAYLESALAAGFIPIFCLYITRFQIQPEERVLRKKFGMQYADYCRRVSRW